MKARMLEELAETLKVGKSIDCLYAMRKIQEEGKGFT